jgi:hypothetical protein
MHPDRTRRTFELVNMVLQLCVYVEMRFKHALGCYRPVEYNAEVQPVLTTPGHGTFPMGHATQAYAVAYVLKSLLNLFPNPQGQSPGGYPTVIEQLDRQAARIATNRVIAGVHFPVDSMAGRMLGVALGEYFVACCVGGATPGRTFNAAFIDGNPTMDFNPFDDVNQGLDNAPGGGTLYSAAPGPNIVLSPLMQYLWNQAKAEWPGKFP